MNVAIGLFTIAAWLVISLAILGAMRLARGKHRLGFWQFTIAQGSVLFTIFTILGGIFRWWYLNEYFDPVSH